MEFSCLIFRTDTQILHRETIRRNRTEYLAVIFITCLILSRCNLTAIAYLAYTFHVIWFKLIEVLHHSKSFKMSYFHHIPIFTDDYWYWQLWIITSGRNYDMSCVYK
jgi:hypothetical protein